VNVYPFIEAEKQRSTTTPGGGNVARACELLKVSRSAYYAHAVALAAGGPFANARTPSSPRGSPRSTPSPMAPTGRRAPTPSSPSRATVTAVSGSLG
jgi:hypothetical protein